MTTGKWLHDARLSGIDGLIYAIMHATVCDYIDGSYAKHNDAVRFLRSKWCTELTGYDGRRLLARLAIYRPDVPTGYIDRDGKELDAWPTKPKRYRADYMREYRQRRGGEVRDDG